jgi:CRISPR system Cascade subunit CasE
MSHFFSRITLAREGLDPQTLSRVLAEDGYQYHALVWRLFPGDGGARCFVFRVDKDRGSGWPSFLVVSSRPPQPLPGVLKVESVRPFAPRLEAGEQIQFCLRANPTAASVVTLDAEALARFNAERARQRDLPPKPYHVRRRFHDVIMAAKKRLGHPLPDQASPDAREALAQAADEAAQAWLLAHAPAWGLEVLQQEDFATGTLAPALEWSAYTQHRLHNKGRALSFSSLDYQGLARVSDPARLVTALTEGVGRAKAFGCGLLLVRRM